MEKTRRYLDRIGIGVPEGESEKRFSDGGQYRFEVPGIQRPGAMRALLDAMEEHDVRVHRVTQTKGIMLLTDDEIEEMAELAREAGIELFLSVGPRATYDTSASARTPEGSRIGYRLRGYDNMVYAVEDVRRAAELGVRGIVVYDEGLLWVLGRMRGDGELPADLHFKVSAHCGHGNPASARLLQDIGADSLNPVRDLQIPMLAAIREAIDISIDVHTENPKSSGGFIRHYEVPDIIRYASPVYLKTGGSVAGHHGWDTTESQARERIRQVVLVRDMIERYYPEAVFSSGKDLAVPVGGR
ncbi:peptidase [Methanothermobacter sp. KEPCO-1]|uniref:U32 family peptidase n=1 Tax=Methanothermobacter sp. KEPCO-1 TaxID=2603820 RepID=UPI0011C73E97|nr:U32 family peptidase [Methanothermobacter sp. KEPCO-1]QEF94876.1 peptidase [Methanothermobacter sp. KEPCO-1]